MKIVITNEFTTLYKHVVYFYVEICLLLEEKLMQRHVSSIPHVPGGLQQSLNLIHCSVSESLNLSPIKFPFSSRDQRTLDIMCTEIPAVLPAAVTLCLSWSLLTIMSQVVLLACYLRTSERSGFTFSVWDSCYTRAVTTACKP